MKRKISSMQKGRIAEKIVRDLFTEAGYRVFKYGYEHILPELSQQRVKIKGKTANYIRHQPDFVVVDNRNVAFFVEVKFRSKGKIKKEDMFNYPSCYVVFLTKDHILAQKLENIYQYGDKFIYLNRLPPFKHIPSKLIFKYVERTRRQLGEETLISQLATTFVEGLTKGGLVRPPKPINIDIIGGELTKKGWERLDKIPPWVNEKTQTKVAKKVPRGKEVNGKHYRFRLLEVEGRRICLRKKKSTKSRRR